MALVSAPPNKLSRVQREINAACGDVDSFAVAVCTVDGQQFRYGTPTHPMPLMEIVKPLLYAIAIVDNGKTATHKVGYSGMNDS